MFKGSIPALVTPMGEDGSIDFGAWEKLLDFHLAAGTDGVVVGGTTGESPVLDRGEIEGKIRDNSAFMVIPSLGKNGGGRPGPAEGA